VINAIEVTNASKIYRRYSRRRQFSTLKSALLSRSLIRNLRPDETFAAVSGVTFTVPRGRTLGVVGRNGSGKSTLLKLVAGITKPTSGSVSVNGRVSALIELGAGFHPEISGRENVFINGIMLGLTKREVARRFDEIVDFAEMKDFIDAPVKTYSSGMYMRLGFAVAIHVDPDVLLVDEVLAVGDEGFTHKCLDKFAEFKRRGKTILLVTHSLGLVERFCDDALWMDGGHMKGMGDPKRIVGAYITDVEVSEEQQLAAGDAKAQQSAIAVSPDEPVSAVLPDHPIETAEGPADMFRATEGRWGSREIEITDVQLTGADGATGHVFHSGQPVTVLIGLRSPIENDDFVIGIGIFNAEGVCVYGTNTNIEELKAVRIFGDAEARFTVDSLDLVEGTYKLDVAIHKLDGYPYDYHRLLYTFRVKSRTKDVGIYRPRHEWRFSDSLAFERTNQSR
jgi:ABC-type polysaccharide/polyol phosphate transport system ATPase subunit